VVVITQLKKQPFLQNHLFLVVFKKSYFQILVS